jgi:hypothetical protein
MTRKKINVSSADTRLKSYRLSTSEEEFLAFEKRLACLMAAAIHTSETDLCRSGIA